MTNEELLLNISDMLDKKIKDTLSKLITDLLDSRFGEVNARFEQIDARFEQIDKRFEQIDARFEQIDKRFEQIDARFERIEATIGEMKCDIKELQMQNENYIIPTLNEIKKCYLSTYQRYSDGVDKLDGLQMDMEVVKSVVAEHSEKLERISIIN